MLNYKTVLHQSSNQPQPVLFYPLQVQFHFYSVAHSLSYRKKKKKMALHLFFTFLVQREKKVGYIIQGHSNSVTDSELIFTFLNF